MKPLRKGVQTLRFINFTGIYKQLFTDASWVTGEKPKDWDDICSLTVNMLDEGKLYYEDGTPFLLLKELIEGFQTNRTIKHVLVDEAQDYSPFQFEFLKRLFPAARMTVLGDFNQAIFAHASETVNFNTLTSLYGPDETNGINLTRSYRSTKPIIEFTRALVPEGKNIHAFERDGEKPTVTKVSNDSELHERITAKVAELQKTKSQHDRNYM